MIQYTISDNNLHLIDSYMESKKFFSTELKSIRELEPNYGVWNRGIPQMCLEWAVHNACYALGIKKEQTKDCDLNYPQPFWERAAYAICGCIVWPFIK